MFQQILRDTAANWAHLNPVLEMNQLGVESDLRNNVEQGDLFAKLGNGVDEWNDLPYWTGTFNGAGILDLPTATPSPSEYFPFVDGTTLSKALINGGVKVYRALLTQSSTDAPVATVLENTLGGTVVWTRDSAGIYVATLTGAFTADKTIAPGRVWFTSSTDVITCAGVRTSANAITYTVNKWHWEDLATNVMEVQDISELGLPATVLLDVEILVYP